MKLDRELTERFFNCTSAEEVAQVVESATAVGQDLETASRISIDEVLNKFYHKRCTGTKKHAVAMLLGAIKGEDVPDAPLIPSITAPSTAISLDQYAKEMSAEGQERIDLLKESADEAVASLKKYYDYTDKILEKSPRLRALRATEEELIDIGKTSKVYVAGKDKSGKIYLMKREPKRMEQAQKEKWNLFL